MAKKKQPHEHGGDEVGGDDAAEAAAEAVEAVAEEEEEEEEGSGDDEDDDDDDCFFESLDRVPSGISFDFEFPSSGSDEDEDEEDDVRVSFASAVGAPSKFRMRAMAMEEGVGRGGGEGGCDGEGEGAGRGFDYGVWMAEPFSIKERRRRLFQGMGLASGKGLSILSSSRSGAGGDAPDRAASRCLSTIASRNAVPGDAHGAATAPAAAAASASSSTPTPSPNPAIARCRSDTHLAKPSTKHSPTALSRSSSAPPSMLDPLRSPSLSDPQIAGHAGSSGAGDGDLMLGMCRIKNLDTGKEFVVSELGKDGTWGRLNDTQTGLQLSLEEFEKFLGYSPIVKELMRRAKNTDNSIRQAFGRGGGKSSKHGGRKKGGWLRNIKFVASSVTGLISEKESTIPKSSSNSALSSSSSSNSSERLKVHQHGKSYKELTGLHMSQEIHAHQGSIWCMKFSSDSRYLASAGEDRIVRVWQVLECNAFSSSSFREQEAAVRSSPPLAPLPVANGSLDDRSASLRSQPSKRTKRGKSSKKAMPDHIVVPETIFSLSEKPICSLEGHLDDVLDLSWSKSQHLLSSSMDKTVRLWDIESKACLKLFAHNDYVTCIQFNPVDDSYFISGSLDAKVRIWSIPDRQVVDWTDLHEMVTATCYTPDGQGALVGSHKGSCRIYKTTDCKLHQEAQIDIRSKKRKSHAKKVTGFQFGPGSPPEVMITSADSQIRVFDSVNMVHKFRGFRNTSSQISASYTSDGKYVVCASEDSHVYIWKREASRSAGAGVKSKSWTTTRSHEHFYCKDVSVAIPWPGCGINSAFSPSLSAFPDRSISNLEDAFPSSRSHFPPLPEKSFSERTLPSSSDEPCSSILHSRSGVGSESFVSASSSIRSSAICSSVSDSANISNSSSTWGWYGGGNGSKNSGSNSPEAASAWGLVVVTAGLGGDIRIYQNFGLPLRLSRQTNLFY